VAGRRLPRPLAGIAGRLLDLGWRARHPESGLDAKEVAVAGVSGFDARYDALWERARSSYAMCVRRDAAYLQWKYVDCPHRRYDLAEATRGDELAGFAVSRHEDRGGVRLGWVIDLFAEADDHAARDALLGHVLDGFRAASVSRAQAFAMSAAVASDLRRRGFGPAPSPMQFCVRARVPSERVLEDLAGWHVMFGDSDMDR
jgi:hypothetical protein